VWACGGCVGLIDAGVEFVSLVGVCGWLVYIVEFVGCFS